MIWHAIFSSLLDYKKSGGPIKVRPLDRISGFKQAMASQKLQFKRKFPLLLTTSLIAASAAATDTQWACKADPNGTGWLCAEKKLAKPSKLKRPSHGYTAVKPEAKQAAPETTPEAAIADTAEETVTPTPAKSAGQLLTTYHNKLDWVPYEELSEELKESVAPHCCGAYIAPTYEIEGEGIALSPKGQPIHASANSSEIEQGGISILEGEVVVQQGYRRIEADRARIDQQNSTAKLTGNVSFREPGILMRGASADSNIDTTETTLHNGSFIVHEAYIRGTAETITKQENGILSLEDAEFTRCEPDSNAWALSASNIKLDREAGVGSATHTVIDIQDVPVFYTPYIHFPIDDRRKSGFLAPSIGSDDDGLNIVTPYYFNLAPNYDATIAPHYMSDRGVLLEGELRHMSEKTEQQVSAAYLGDDDEYKGEDRWLSGFNHQGRIGSGWSSHIDFTRVSDDDYFDDLDTTLDIARKTHLEQVGRLSYSSQYISFSAEAQSYQTIDDSIAQASEPFRELPKLKLDINYPQESTGLEYTLDSEYTFFYRNLTNLTTTQQTDGTEGYGQRLNITPGISLPMEWPFGFLTPSIKLAHIQYDLSNNAQGTNSTPSTTVPIISIDGGLIFERDFTFNNSEFIQTLEPRLFYLNVPYEDQSGLPDFDTGENSFSYSALFRENRFSGGDRVGDTDQLTVGVTSRILDDTGFEHTRLSLGQAFYYRGRRVDLTSTINPDEGKTESATVGEWSYRFNKDWYSRATIEYDTHNDVTDESSFSLRYNPDVNHIFNASYRHVNKSTDQSDISMILPISDDWSVLGRWRNDMIAHTTLETLFGLEYESCCWKTRVIARRYLKGDSDSVNAIDAEFDSGIFLQFQLKGLGGIGNKVDGILDDAILGYREREDFYK